MNPQQYDTARAGGAWWGGEGRSGAELSPRKQPPTGFGAQTMSRVQPMVPELSMFFPSTTSRVSFCEENLRSTAPARKPQQNILQARQPLAPVDENVSHSGSTGSANQKPAIPANFSADTQTFEYLERTVGASKENQGGMVANQPRHPPPPQSNQPNSQAARPTVPQPGGSLDVVDMLIKQNDRIQKLQDQVERLLLERSDQGSNASSIDLAQRSSKVVTDGSTQTSAPPSPRKISKPAGVETATSTRELSDTIFSPVSRRTTPGDDSIELGESATMYGRQKNAMEGNPRIVSEPAEDPEECDELLDQIQRALTGPAEEARRTPKQKPVVQEAATNKSMDVAAATYNRLKQMGVSFLSPEDIRKKSNENLNYDTLYRPRLDYHAYPSSSSHPVQSFTTDSSLAINSAALKYLDDQQLAHLAIRQKEQQQSRKSPLVPTSEPGITRFGLPENQLSMATKQFLEGNRFQENPQPKQDGIVKNMTQLLQQPKFS